MQQIPEATTKVVFRKETNVEGITGTFIIETPGLQSPTTDYSQPPYLPKFDIIAPIENITDALSNAQDYAQSKDRDDAIRLIKEFLRDDLQSEAQQFANFVCIGQLAEACEQGQLLLDKWSENDIAVWLAISCQVMSDIANLIGYGIEDDKESTFADDVSELCSQFAQFWTVKRSQSRRDMLEMTYTVEEVEDLEIDDGGPDHQRRARETAIAWAKAMRDADGDFVILDLETTGLDGDAEICQIGLLSSTGDVLMDQLIKPTEPIPTTASNIHGITDDMVKDAPTFDAIYEQLCDLIIDREVVIFNAAFDSRVLAQVCRRHGLLEATSVIGSVHCAMLQYADFRGDWNDYHGNSRWPKLTYAIDEFKIDLGDGKAHDAMTDCRITLALIEGMAGYAQAEVS